LVTKERQLEATVKQLEVTVKQLEATVKQLEATVEQMEAKGGADGGRADELERGQGGVGQPA
jgi:multidrug resistance efflux pump